MHLRLLLITVIVSHAQLYAGQNLRLAYTTQVTPFTDDGSRRLPPVRIQPFYLTVHQTKEGNPYALYCHPLVGKKSGNLLLEACTLFHCMQELIQQEQQPQMFADLYACNTKQVIHYLCVQSSLTDIENDLAKKPSQTLEKTAAQLTKELAHLEPYFYRHALMSALTGELVAEEHAYQNPNNPKPLPTHTLLDVIKASIKLQRNLFNEV